MSNACDGQRKYLKKELELQKTAVSSVIFWKFSMFSERVSLLNLTRTSHLPASVTGTQIQSSFPNVIIRPTIW
jgi:hypothetical protein